MTEPNGLRRLQVGEPVAAFSVHKFIVVAAFIFEGTQADKAQTQIETNQQAPRVCISSFVCMRLVNEEKLGFEKRKKKKKKTAHRSRIYFFFSRPVRL